MAPAATSSTRCLRGGPWPILAVVTALRPNITPAAAATPAATLMPADPASPRPERCERDLPCADSMRAGLPGSRGPNRFPDGDYPGQAREARSGAPSPRFVNLKL